MKKQIRTAKKVFTLLLALTAFMCLMSCDFGSASGNTNWTLMTSITGFEGTWSGSGQMKMLATAGTITSVLRLEYPVTDPDTGNSGYVLLHQELFGLSNDEYMTKTDFDTRLAEMPCFFANDDKTEMKFVLNQTTDPTTIMEGEVFLIKQ